jgi:hypothetical protein
MRSKMKKRIDGKNVYRTKEIRDIANPLVARIVALNAQNETYLNQIALLTQRLAVAEQAAVLEEARVAAVQEALVNEVQVLSVGGEAAVVEDGRDSPVVVLAEGGVLTSASAGGDDYFNIASGSGAGSDGEEPTTSSTTPVSTGWGVYAMLGWVDKVEAQRAAVATSEIAK